MFCAFCSLMARYIYYYSSLDDKSTAAWRVIVSLLSGGNYLQCVGVGFRDVVPVKICDNRFSHLWMVMVECKISPLTCLQHSNH